MISVYDAGNEKFTSLGNAILTPLSGKVKQVAGGSYELTIVHPIDTDGKWTHLVPGAIVKAPIPAETIENAFSGYDADVYTANADTGLRETATDPQLITYQSWVSGRDYNAGDKVTLTYNGRNYQAVVDIRNAATTAAPNLTYYWREIARYTAGPNILVTLPAGTELYLVADVDATWYKMSTYYGIEGYVKKAEVTYSKHLSPTETVAHEITEQLFRLREPMIDNDNNTVTVTGLHVSYDLAGIVIKSVNLVQKEPAFALSKITEAFMIPYRGTIATNLTAENGTYTGEIKGKNGIFALLDPDKGIVAAFNAKYARDNWDLYVMKKNDVDRGFRIQYGKNARGITWKRSNANLVTRVVPVARNEDGTDLYLPEQWIDSANIGQYPVIRMEYLPVNSQVGRDKKLGDGSVWTEADLLDEMRAMAGARFSIDHADQIEQEVTIQFEQLGDTEEFAALKGLEKVLLYDTVTAIDERIGLSMQLYVTEIEYDILREKVSAVKLRNINDFGGRNVTGYNVQNNSIGPAKLTDEAKQEIISQALYQSGDMTATQGKVSGYSEGTFTDMATAAAAVLGGMTDGTVKIGRFTAGGMAYLFTAVRNTSTDGAVFAFTNNAEAKLIANVGGSYSVKTITAT